MSTSTLLINSTARESYEERINKALNDYYSRPSKKTSLEKLRLRRNRLLNEMRVVAEKLFSLERECFSPVVASLTEIEELNLSLDIFKEIFINKQQKEILANLSKKEKYLSELCKAYQKELVAIELQILSINSQSTNLTKVA